MTTSAKRRLTLAVLTVVTLWPAVQIALVKRYDVSSWKLMGFGMYATPRPLPDFQFLASRGGPFEVQGRVDLGVTREELLELRYRRATLGELATPDDLAATILKRRPEIEALRVRIELPRLDAQGFIRGEVSEYDYRREPGAGPEPEAPADSRGSGEH